MTKYSKDAFAECVNNEDGDDDDDDNVSATSNGDDLWAKAGDASTTAAGDALSVVASVFTLNGRPFSAVARQLLPKYFEEAEENFDEFGFRLLETNNCDDPTKEHVSPMETSQQRIKWLALIEFTHEHVEHNELLWRDVEIQRVRDAPKFTELMYAEGSGGVPHSLRPFLWPRLNGARAKRDRAPHSYALILKRANVQPEQIALVEPQIEKDLLRTLPTNYAFGRMERQGTKALRRVLKAVAFMYPDLGYCQGMGVVVAALLLICAEEDVFWIMSALIEDILPANYYSPSLLGVRVDERIVNHLMQIHMPELAELVKKSELNMSMITINWLITLLSSVLPMRVLFRVWDHLFAYGSVIVFRAIISMLKMNEGAILERSADSRHLLMSDLFALIQRIPQSLTDADGLLEVMRSFEYTITDHLIEELRKKHQAILMADKNREITFVEQAGIDSISYSRQRVNRRQLSSMSRNIFNQFLHHSDKKDYGDQLDDTKADDPRTKNIRQTEMVMELRHAILEICAHFVACDAEPHDDKSTITQADYTPECEARDREAFLLVRREGRKRARALLDFERQDVDELGFRRGQLITILSERDEHCWVGELDGERGWFPAKFVEVVDERGKNYCVRGDEALDGRVVALTRGALSSAVRRILFHGMRRPSRISTFVAHPWTFIESLSGTLVEKQRDAAARSRLTLCDTFKLDEDGKVLSAEELLYRAIQAINGTHVPVHASLDAKLRSLIAYALNEQCLHLWFDIFCNSKDPTAIRVRYYHSWSFIRSPVAHQIKCELRLLSQFAFNLDVDGELKAAVAARAIASAGAISNGGESSQGGSLAQSTNTDGLRLTAPGSESPSAAPRQPLKEGVRDMLIKHHLFSWDL